MQSLKCGGDFVTLDLTEFSVLVSDALYQASDINSITLSDIKLICRKKPDAKDIMSVSELHQYGIPIFDYFVYLYLKRIGQKVNFSISIESKQCTFTEYLQSIFSIYFILMTRAKVDMGMNEQMPKFLTSYLGIKLSITSMHEILSSNPLNKMSHLWIRDVKISKLAKAVQQRLNSGIAGSRLFNVFKLFVPTNVRNLDPKLMSVYNMVKRIAQEGPFYEMHPLFLPKEMYNISISKNLSNLLIDIYTQAELNEMVKNKILYSLPKLDGRFTSYRDWEDKIFQGFTTRLLD